MIKWEGKKANSLVRITKYIRCLGGKKKVEAASRQKWGLKKTKTKGTLKSSLMEVRARAPRMDFNKRHNAIISFFKKEDNIRLLGERKDEGMSRRKGDSKNLDQMISFWRKKEHKYQLQVGVWGWGCKLEEDWKALRQRFSTRAILHPPGDLWQCLDTFFVGGEGTIGT